jgi:hypothetical protein
MAGRFIYKHTLGSAQKSIKAATEDYRVVFKELGEDIRARPVSSALRVCALAAFGAVCLNAPSERDYIDALSTAESDLIECGGAVKRAAVRHVNERLTLRDQGRLQHLWLGPVSIALRRDEPVQLHRFDAAYESFPHQVTTLRGRFLDIGAVGRWLRLEQSMVDYDIDDQL